MIHIQSDTDIQRAFDVMRQLRPHLANGAEFMRRVREGEKKEGYLLFCFEEGEEIVAVCGVQPFVTLYYEKVLWICDLVTSDACRSQGYGARLMGEVEEWAQDNGYLRIALSSGIQRVDAHRFYTDKMKYAMTSYIFEKRLPQKPVIKTMQ